MSRQYFDQVKSVKNNYKSAYESLKSYCTGWRTVFNSKRWAIRRLLKSIDKLQINDPSEIIHQAITQIPSLADISPASKLAAVFNVIQQKNQLDQEAQEKLQKIIKLDKKSEESTAIKLLQKYSAWWIVRLFTGELNNAHVKEVRACLKQYQRNEVNYETLIQNIQKMNALKEDPLNDFKEFLVNKYGSSRSELSKEKSQEHSVDVDSQDTPSGAEESPKEKSLSLSRDAQKPEQEGANKLEMNKSQRQAEQREQHEQVKLAELQKEKEKQQKVELARLQQEAERKEREEQVRKEEQQKAELAWSLKEAVQKEQIEQEELLKKSQQKSELLNEFSEQDLLKAREQLVEIKNNFESFISVYNAPFYQREYPGYVPAEFKKIICAFYDEAEGKLALNDLELRQFLKNGFADFVEWAAEYEKEHQTFLEGYKKARDQENARLKLLAALNKSLLQVLSDLKNFVNLLSCDRVMLGITEELRAEKEKSLGAIIERLKSYDNNSMKNYSFAQLQDIDSWIASLPKELQLLKVDHHGNDLQGNYHDNSERIQNDINLINKMLSGLKQDVQEITFRQKMEFEHAFDISALIQSSNELLEDSELILNSFKQITNKSTIRKFDRLEQLKALPERIKAQRDCNKGFIQACKVELEKRKSEQAGALQIDHSEQKQPDMSSASL